jgi:hypothetical protein
VLTVGLLRCSPAGGLSRSSALVFAVDQVGGARAMTVVMRGAPQRSTGEQAPERPDQAEDGIEKPLLNASVV